MDPCTYFPREIVLEIAKFSNPESRCRLRAVSKSWYDIVSDPHVWASGIDFEHVYFFRPFKAPVALKKCLDYAFLNTTVNRLRYLYVGEFIDKEIECKCIKLLRKDNFAYFGKTIDELWIESDDMRFENDYYSEGETEAEDDLYRDYDGIYNLIPVKKLGITFRKRLVEVDLGALLRNQGNTLEFLLVVTPILSWKDDFSTKRYDSLVALEIEFRIWRAPVMASLFLKCPQLKKLNLISERQIDLNLLLRCTTGSLLELLTVKIIYKEYDIKVYSIRSDSPLWQPESIVSTTPRWPEHLKELSLLNVEWSNFGNVQGSLKGLELLNFYESNINMVEFFDIFNCGKNLKSLNVGGDHELQSEYDYSVWSKCPNLEIIFAIRSEVNDDDVDMILDNCSKLKKFHIGNSKITRKSIIAMLDKQITPINWRCKIKVVDEFNPDELNTYPWIERDMSPDFFINKL